MIKKIILSTFLIFGIALSAVAQSAEVFSLNRDEFLNELEKLLSTTKQKTVEDKFKQFKEQFQTGNYTEDDWVLLREAANAMLQKKLATTTYLVPYMDCLLSLKSNLENEAKYKGWHEVYLTLLNDPELKSVNQVREFLIFSSDFFLKNALRSSSGGINWIASGSKAYKMVYEGGQVKVQYPSIDLKAVRGKDSILIQGTAGTFMPFENTWLGQGGTVTWERVGLKGVYCELEEYEIDTRKSIYKVPKAYLTYPEIFDNKRIEGKFEDKIIALTDVTTGLFPRFKSRDSLININEKLGKGIYYQGGFQLEGTRINGLGSKGNEAEIKVYDDGNDLKFIARSERFVVRKNQQIGGNGVSITLYLYQDSIFHPSVNLKYNIEEQELNLYRGQRGSDRNPFFDSYHQVNIDSDQLDWFIPKDSIIVGRKTFGIGGAKNEAVFESLKFYQEADYRKLQNIASVNPISTFKAVAAKDSTSTLRAEYLAQKLNPRYSVKSIQGLLYEMAAQGFINYDSEKELVEVKDKVFHYENASRESVDYDVLKIQSSASNQDNAVLSLKDNNYQVNGVKYVEFSPVQKVAVKPFDNQIQLKKNRNMYFDGKVFAGFSILTGEQFNFNYDRFKIDMDSVRYFDLFVPTGQLDKFGNKEAVAIVSRIEHLKGVLLIDAPSNKSGVQDIEMFPSFNSLGPSYVFYDKGDIQDGVYERDSFYFELTPFSLNRLDNYIKGDIKFDGTLISDEIFPDIDETLVLMGEGENQSLGFITETPEEGYGMYQDLGDYTGQISLSNDGLLGKGELKYLGASAQSDDIIFKPEQLLASAELFRLKEDRESDPEFPEAFGYDVKIDWRPYQDSMYIRSQDRPFEIYKEPGYELEGTLILTPGGLKANGLFDWSDGRMRSKLLSFGAYSVAADTAMLEVKSLENEGEVALSNDNVKGSIDFDELLGHFEANADEDPTSLPYNQFKTTMNTFDWDLNNKLITFESDLEKLATFFSVQPDQDSLTFEGKTASYNLKTSELFIGGVPFIFASDAYIYPSDGRVFIGPNGIMSTLEEARIIADTTNKYHVINRATVDIKGRRNYSAKGYYEYNLENREQEILFSDIIGQPLGKGSYSKKKSVTTATGEVTEEDKFYIDTKTEFQGTISLRAASKLLQFDGFARLDVPDMPNRQWFSINSPGDKKNLTIQFDTPKTDDGFPVYSGLFLSKETGLSYPRIMMPLFFRKDRVVLDAKGFFRYDKENDAFLFGDSLRVADPESIGGRLLTYSIPDGKITGQGIFGLGSQLNYVTANLSGLAETSFSSSQDTTSYEGVGTELNIEAMVGINLNLPDNLFDIILNDLKANSFDALSIRYRPAEVYQNAVKDLFPDIKNMVQTLDVLKNEEIFNVTKKENNYQLVFSCLPLKWNPEFYSFVSMKDKIGLTSVNGEMVNRMLKCFIEFRMPPKDGDDRLYIYFESPSGYYYYFGYKQGILTTVSNNVEYNDEVAGMKKKQRLIKMPDDGYLEIQLEEPAKANTFISRVKAARD